MDYSIWLQPLMELALSVSGESDLQTLYEKFSKTLLKKLDCTTVAIVNRNLTIEYISPKWGEKHINSFIDEMVFLRFEGDYGFKKYKERFYYVYSLNENGYIVFIRGAALPYELTKELLTINHVFYNSMIGCKAFEKQNETEKLLSRQMDFQHVMMSLAMTFINVSVEELDEGISRALCSAGYFLGIDRAYVFQYDFDKRVMNNTHEWCNVGIKSEKENLQNISIDDFFEGWTEEHINGKSVVISSIEELDSSSSLYSILQSQSIKSIITLPLIAEKKVIGFVGFDSVTTFKKWENDEVSFLLLLAELFTNAFIKKARELELKKIKNLLSDLSMG